MRRIVPIAVALALACLVTPASAFVAQVTTSVAVKNIDDTTALADALQSAVDGVLKNAISFTPTVVVVTEAFVVGDRLYVRLMLADEDGERLVGELTRSAPPSVPGRVGSAELRI